jgi:hypothetical protein
VKLWVWICWTICRHLSDRLLRFMWPNTPHFVYTPSNTICHSAHFYATSTIRETCYGLIHSFVAACILSNTSHKTESRLLLQRMITHYHSAFFDDGRAYIWGLLPFNFHLIEVSVHTVVIRLFEGFIDFLIRQSSSMFFVWSHTLKTAFLSASGALSLNLADFAARFLSGFPTATKYWPGKVNQWHPANISVVFKGLCYFVRLHSAIRG